MLLLAIIKCLLPLLFEKQVELEVEVEVEGNGQKSHWANLAKRQVVVVVAVIIIIVVLCCVVVGALHATGP